MIILISSTFTLILVVKAIADIISSSARGNCSFTSNKVRILGMTVTAVLLTLIRTISDIITVNLLTPFMVFTWLVVTGMYVFKQESKSEQNQ